MQRPQDTPTLLSNGLAFLHYSSASSCRLDVLKRGESFRIRLCRELCSSWPQTPSFGLYDFTVVLCGALKLRSRALATRGGIAARVRVLPGSAHRNESCIDR